MKLLGGGWAHPACLYTGGVGLFGHRPVYTEGRCCSDTHSGATRRPGVHASIPAFGRNQLEQHLDFRFSATRMEAINSCFESHPSAVLGLHCLSVLVTFLIAAAGHLTQTAYG